MLSDGFSGRDDPGQELNKFVGPLGLEACVITRMLCTIHDLSFLYEGPSGAKSNPGLKDPEPLFDHWALHGVIFLVFWSQFFN